MTKKVRQKVSTVTVAAILVDIRSEEGDGHRVGVGELISRSKETVALVSDAASCAAVGFEALGVALF